MPSLHGMTAEELRLEASNDRTEHWKRWGPYLSERSWGTVREDYSEDGTAWEYLPHDHARSKAYRWNEDGIAGISDRHQKICFSVALWNGRDPILKERLFGLTGNEGNHGEDVKECYYYLDSTPTHSYMKYLYKYPQAEFPYERLVNENRERGRGQREFELLDTGVFADNRYFDVFVEYAKAECRGHSRPHHRRESRTRSRDVCMSCRPIWFRNTWSWMPGEPKPHDAALSSDAVGHRVERADIRKARGRFSTVRPSYCSLKTKRTSVDSTDFKTRRRTPRTASTITSCMDVRMLSTGATGDQSVRALSFSMSAPAKAIQSASASRTRQAQPDVAGANFDEIFTDRIREADEFYEKVIPAGPVTRRPQRDAAGVRGHAVVEAVLSLRRRAIG